MLFEQKKTKIQVRDYEKYIEREGEKNNINTTWVAYTYQKRCAARHGKEPVPHTKSTLHQDDNSSFKAPYVVTPCHSDLVLKSKGHLIQFTLCRDTRQHPHRYSLLLQSSNHASRGAWVIKRDDKDITPLKGMSCHQIIVCILCSDRSSSSRNGNISSNKIRNSSTRR